MMETQQHQAQQCYYSLYLNLLLTSGQSWTWHLETPKPSAWGSINANKGLSSYFLRTCHWCSQITCWRICNGTRGPKAKTPGGSGLVPRSKQNSTQGSLLVIQVRFLDFHSLLIVTKVSRSQKKRERARQKEAEDFQKACGSSDENLVQ
jgi:hypothetical protein